MFRKSKPKIEPPPPTPSVEEMFEDLKTFEINQTSISNATDGFDLEQALLTESADSLTLPTWWKVFDEYERKVKKLAASEEDLEHHRIQLQECRDKLGKNANALREGIKKQQAMAKEALNVN
ncbi:uncharacterized protein [Drosophila kikkawai]|uniref:Uncharacterized protein n=1 Tax=Drosophila kikkawai TaxID=30033 RepID=A0A6P4JPR7_DROKI|nr:uncharacterized protein LOC108084923 [Drosophila kikkawai]